MCMFHGTTSPLISVVEHISCSRNSRRLLLGQELLKQHLLLYKSLVEQGHSRETLHLESILALQDSVDVGVEGRQGRRGNLLDQHEMPEVIDDDLLKLELRIEPHKILPNSSIGLSAGFLNLLENHLENLRHVSRRK